MANANYDAHDLAKMFRTLEQQSGASGPQWMSDHPNPGNRYEYISREAEALHVTNPIHTTDEFTRVQQILRDMGRAPSMQEVARGAGRYPQGGGGRYPQGGQQGGQRYPDQNDPNYPDQNNQRYPDQSSRRYPDQSGQRDSGRRGRQGQVESPSSRFRTYNGNNFRIQV